MTPKRRKFTQQEMLSFAEYPAAEVTTDEVTYGDLIINATESGLMMEGPGGVETDLELDTVLLAMGYTPDQQKEWADYQREQGQ